MQYWLSNTMVSPNIKYAKYEYELHTVFVLKESQFSELVMNVFTAVYECIT